MSRATASQIAACRTLLVKVAERVRGVSWGDHVTVDGVRVAERIGHTVVVPELWNGSRKALGSKSFFSSDRVEDVVAAVSQRIATSARLQEVSRAA